MYVLSADARKQAAGRRVSRQGYGWVRVAPLVLVGQTAPYLHNGSVPTLAALLEEPSRRPRRFAVWRPAQKFEFDTALPGNHNGGHVFGTDLSVDDKHALIAYLESLP